MPRVGARDQSFWVATMAGIALFIVFAFAQFAARGFVDYARAPAHLHLHGAVMIAWLALAVTQAALVHRDSLALHRRLGWLGVILAAAVTVLGSYSGIHAVIAGRQPPFFSPPYFLALTQIGIACFAGLVAAAVARRRQSEWHRRLMVGAMIMILEPALGRVLPMPLIMPWGEWAVLLCQLFVFAILIRHDRRTMRRVHPATLAALTVVVLSHVAIELLAAAPAFAEFAAGLAGA
jgi:uncharacterized membrane protein